MLLTDGRRRYTLSEPRHVQCMLVTYHVVANVRSGPVRSAMSLQYGADNDKSLSSEYALLDACLTVAVRWVQGADRRFAARTLSFPFAAIEGSMSSSDAPTCLSRNTCHVSLLLGPVVLVPPHMKPRRGLQASMAHQVPDGTMLPTAAASFAVANHL